MAVVLLVSPRSDCRRAGRALEERGHLVVSARDAAGARQRLAAEPHDLIVVDAELPDGAAYDLCARIRAGEEHARVPVVVVAGPWSEEAALSAGASAVLGHPIDAEELAELTTAFVESPAPAALDEALAELRDGRAEEAVRRLRAVADDAPRAIAAWAQYHLGRAQAARGDVQAAAEEYASVLDDDPRAWRAHVRLGQLHERAGHVEAGLEHFRHALELKPDQQELRALFGLDDIAEEMSIDVEGEAPAEPASGEALGTRLPTRGSDVATPTGEQEEAAGSRPLVLVADDSELALGMTAEALRTAGYDVMEASDGRQALRLARERRPDLLLLDGLMPGATGFDVCKEVKHTLYADDPPPVLIYSAVYTKHRQRTEAMELYGADGVLAKETSPLVLLEQVRRWIVPG